MISNINIFAFIMLLFVAAHALAQISTPKESAPEKIDRPEATRALQVAMPQTAQEAVDLPTAPDVATVSTAITSDSTPRESREPNLQLLLSSETRYIETDLVNRKSMEGASLFDVAASGTLAIDPTLRLNFDVAAERMNDQSVFFPRVVTAQWMPWRWTSAEVGQFFIPVGFYVERDQWFSALPHYYRQILYWERGSDIGARFSVSPWPSGVLSAEASTFSGRTTRPGDQRPGPPEKAPQLISLRSHSSYHEVFVQHFAHQVAFGRQMNATGVGFGVFYEFKEWRLRPELWTEGFEIRQKQTQEIGRAHV